MFKKFIYILLLLCSNLIVAQFGVIKYKVSVNIDIKTAPKETIGMFESINSLVQKQEFELKFSDKVSVFDIIPSLKESSNKETKLYYRIARVGYTCGTKVYYEKNANTIYEIHENGIITKDVIGKDFWQITSETKKIDKYNCIKAFHTINFLTRNGEKTSRIITAWFAPSLPYSFGPKTYSGLPGLIVELLDKNTTFTATSIKLSKNDIAIKLPKGKAISKEDYDKKIKQQMGM